MRPSEEDATRIVRLWLEDGVTGLPDRVLDAVLDQLSGTPQRQSSWLARRSPIMNNTVRLIAAAGAVAVVALVAYQLLIAPNVGGPTTTDPSPSAAVTPTPVPPDGPIGVLLTPGRHVITDVAPFRITITLPEGWSRPSSLGTVWAASSDVGDIGFTTEDPPSCVRVSGYGYGGDIAEITLDGFVGVRIEARTRASCHPNLVLDALSVPGGRGGYNYLTLWVLDVDGEELTMYAWTIPPDGVRQEELRQLVESVQIERP